jgi:hypothetical protein
MYKFRLPIYPSFKNRILPILVVYWLLAAIFTSLDFPISLVIAAWATVTTIMLWPVETSIKYTQYRSPWFIIGVFSMVGIPAFGYLIITASSAWIKYFSVIGLAIDIGIWGIPLCLKSAFGRPVRMLFRPDLIFGDGRILAGGIVAIGLGMKFIFTNAPPGDIPKGNWYALFLVILLGLLQIIPFRGMWKMRNRITRILVGKWSSFWATALKEFYLIVAITFLLFSFHNFFGGAIPFTRNVLAGSIEGELIMIISSLYLIILRSYYKIKIGDPFFFETFKQTLIKNSILVSGLIPFFYGYLNVMVDSFPRVPNAGDFSYLTYIGLALMSWGIVLLIPIRSWAQRNQREAIMDQMVKIILPILNKEDRVALFSKALNKASSLNDDIRYKIMKILFSKVTELDKDKRKEIMNDMMESLTKIEDSKKKEIMSTMDKILGFRL